MTRRQRAWGGSAWTLPIPTKPRIHGDFTCFPRYVWLFCDVLRGTRGGDLFATSGCVATLHVRTHDDPTWAEVDHVFGFDPA